ncbi:MAG: hypothetical protein M1835_004416 [Candelina submexicana]|nr:MAG: hypothetical protein M1835_004416 [Candelina submexicana]
MVSDQEKVGDSRDPKLCTTRGSESVPGRFLLLGSESAQDSRQAYEQEARDYVDKLAPGIYNYEYENGRRYHSSDQGSYWLPNDEPEIHRLNQQHHCFTLLKGGKLHLAPLPSTPLRILDVGTGTGIWCIQMAQQYPNAEIVGTDLSPIQPDTKPSNVTFVVEDAEKPWSFPDSHFDFVHMSLMHGSIADWPALVQKIKHHLKPSGILEMQEMATSALRSDDNTVKPEQAYARWCVYMKEAALKRGRPVNIGPYLVSYLNGANFKDINESVYKLYLKPYPEDEFGKMIGAYTLINLLSGIEGFTTRLFTGVLGWTTEEVKGFVEECKQDLTDPNVHSYINL